MALVKTYVTEGKGDINGSILYTRMAHRVYDKSIRQIQKETGISG